MTASTVNRCRRMSTRYSSVENVPHSIRQTHAPQSSPAFSVVTDSFTPQGHVQSHSPLVRPSSDYSAGGWALSKLY